MQRAAPPTEEDGWSTVLEAARYKLKLTPEEFFEIVGEDDKAELIDGEAVVASPLAGIQHGHVQRFWLTILNLFVQHHQLGEVFGEQTAMRLGQNVFIPDISFLSNTRQDRLEPGYIRGPMDLAIELVSPDDPDRDRMRKRAAYTQAGVPKHWPIDLQSRQINPYRLASQG